jgi:hypothetical protein
MVYVVEALDVFGFSLGLWKIGFTGTSPEGRLDTIQTGNPWPCRLIALFDCPTKQDEDAIHRFLEGYRSREGSGEWFALKVHDWIHLVISKVVLQREVKMRPLAEISGQAAQAIQDNMLKVYIQQFWRTDRSSAFNINLGTKFQEVWRHYYHFCEQYGNKQMQADQFFKQLSKANIGFKLDSTNDYVYNMQKK